MTKKTKGISEIVSSYQKNKTFKPENFQELGRLFGPDATIDMNRLTCQQQPHVASAYMRRIRKTKAKQQDVYFKSLQNIPIRIRRVAVEAGYQDPYVSFKNRLPRLGHDATMAKPFSPQVNTAGKSYVPHNTLSPHIDILFSMNPAGNPHKGIKPLPAPKMKSPFNGENDSSNNNSPRKSKNKNFANDILQKQLRKRLKDTNYGFRTPRNIDADLSPRSEHLSPRVDNSSDNTPRLADTNTLSPHQYSNNMHQFTNANSPRNKQAFWNFNVPTELNNGNKKTHVNSIPQNKNAMAAIYSVQKYNKPLPAITIKC